MTEDSHHAQRIDKWLWAARFFKTRGLAADAVGGGKVHLNGQRVKPAKTVVVGDELHITRGQEEFVVVVKALNEKRGSASVAQTLFEEPPEHKAKREAERDWRQLQSRGAQPPPSRPDKKARRELTKLRRSADE